MNVLAPEVQQRYSSGPPSTNRALSNKNRISFTEPDWLNKTVRQEDEETFLRYWKNLRAARKKRDWEDAFWWLNEMRTLKRFLNTTIEERYPPIYSKAHQVLAFLHSMDGGTPYSKLAEMGNVDGTAIRNVIRKTWKEISDDMAQLVYDRLYPIAKQRGYQDD